MDGVGAIAAQVDVWAVGVLAYELVVGKPPFEVQDEAQTASLIMHSDDIRFPPPTQRQSTALWADFVRFILVKDPVQRPSAAQAMQHPWCASGAGMAHVKGTSAPGQDCAQARGPCAHPCLRRIAHHLNTALRKAAAEGRVSSKQALLEPLPLPAGQPVKPVDTLAGGATPRAAAPKSAPAPARPPAPPDAPPATPCPPAPRSLPATATAPASAASTPHAAAASGRAPALAVARSLFLPKTHAVQQPPAPSSAGATLQSAAATSPSTPQPPAQASRSALGGASGASASSGGGSAASFASASSTAFEAATHHVLSSASASLALPTLPEGSAASDGSVASGIASLLLRSCPSAPAAATALLPPPPAAAAAAPERQWLPASPTPSSRSAAQPPAPGLRTSLLSKLHDAGASSSVDAGLAPPGALLQSAHATVTVTRSGAAAAPPPKSPPGAAGSQLAPPPSAAKARPAVPSLQRQIAAMRLQPAEDGGPETPGSTRALPSPTPAAGHKQRAMAHLKHQAGWSQ